MLEKDAYKALVHIKRQYKVVSFGKKIYFIDKSNVINNEKQVKCLTNDLINLNIDLIVYHEYNTEKASEM